VTSHPALRTIVDPAMAVCPHLRGLSIDRLAATDCALIPSIEAAGCAECWPALMELARARFKTFEENPGHRHACDICGAAGLTCAEAVMRWWRVGNVARALLVACPVCMSFVTEPTS
jgi:hypothetical protein